MIGDECPTFSWSGAPGADAYELVVYRLGEEYEEGEPVIRQTFAGSASSWTPSLGSCLERGGRYAWSLRGTGKEATSEWSKPRVFGIATGPTEAELHAALAAVREVLEQSSERTVPEAVAGTPAAQASGGSVVTGDDPTPLGTPPTPHLSVDGPVSADSYQGDGSLLTSLDPANLSSAVPLSMGGTGAADAADARSNLDVAKGPHIPDTNTNAQTICGPGELLDGGGGCVTKTGLNELSCGDGQVLTYESGTWVCETPFAFTAADAVAALCEALGFPTDCDLRTSISCGDNVVNFSEACDDGNTVDGDGCSSTCMLQAFCGDGNLDTGEECDDGNNVDFDGCSADCAQEGDGGAIAFDANGDSLNDVLVWTPSGTEPDILRLASPTGTELGGYFNPATELPQGYTGRRLHVGEDIDLDGDLDVVFVHDLGIAAYINNDSAAFTTSELLNNSLGNVAGLKLADMNCDGFIDLVVSRLNQTNQVYVGNGVGFAATPSLVLPSLVEPTRGIGIGDVDLDGDNDLLFANDNAVQNRLHYNNCANAPMDPWLFSDAQYGPSTNFPVSGFNTKDAALFDIDSDGWLDAVIANNGQSTRIYFNGGGNFSNDDLLHFPQFTRPNTAMWPVDYDIDGDIDLLIESIHTPSTPVTKAISFFSNDQSQGGVGVFSEETTVINIWWPNWNDWNGEDAVGFAVGDFNGDGWPDIYVHLRGQQDKVFIRSH